LNFWSTVENHDYSKLEMHYYLSKSVHTSGCIGIYVTSSYLNFKVNEIHITTTLH